MGGGKGDIITSLPGIRREAFFGLLGRRYDDDSHDCPALDGSVDSEVGGKNRMGNGRDFDPSHVTPTTKARREHLSSSE